MTKEEQQELNNELMTVIFVGEGNLEKVKELIAKGADAEYKDSDGWTPVYIATARGHLNILKYLHEENGAKVNIKDSKNVTPLHIAVRDARLDIVKYLFFERNALMPILGMFKFPDLIKKKMRRETESQSILDYFLQNKSNYTMKEIQEFKKKFLDFPMGEEDSSNLKSIVKFL